MNMTISYGEILALMSAHFNVTPRRLVMEDAKSLRMELAKNVFPLSLPVTSIIIRIDEVGRCCLSLTYKNVFSDMAGAFTNVVSKLSNKVERQLYNYVSKKMPDGIDVDVISRRIDIDMSRLARQPMLGQYVSLSDVSFTSSGVDAVFDLH